MSKIKDINLALEDQANKIGFLNLQQALQAGCEVDWESIPPRLVEPLTAAHEAWLKEREEALAAIGRLKSSMENIYGEDFTPEIAAIAIDGDPDKVFRYLDVLKIEKFVKESND